jgi:hypothetical protein
VNELDEIMSGAGEAMPENTTQEPTQQPRDEAGRFAANELPTHGHVIDGKVLDARDAETQHPNAEEQQPHTEAKPNGGVPVKAVQEEREKRQAAQAEAEALRRELAELRGMVMARQQPAAAHPQQEQKPASLWDDPDAYLQSQLTPVQREMQETREMLWEIQASSRHGAEKVEAAKKAAEASTPEEKAALHRQLMAGGNPFDNLVKWHQQNQVMSRIGNDPDAWLQQEIERRLNDPAEQAKILERIRTGAAANTSRSQPATNLPPSLNRLPAGGNQPADTDMSDGALFNFATSR